VIFFAAPTYIFDLLYFYVCVRHGFLCISLAVRAVSAEQLAGYWNPSETLWNILGQKQTVISLLLSLGDVLLGKTEFYILSLVDVKLDFAFSRFTCFPMPGLF